MDEGFSLSCSDSLLCHLGLQIRELSQKKNEYSQQIEVYRADIAEWQSRVENLNKNIKALEEEIRVKQSSVNHNKAVAKSMKVTNSRLLQYEKMLKAELERRKASYSDDKEVFRERIAGYRKIFQSHKEYYNKNPLAQKLLGLQAENEEIEHRIKTCDDLIVMKQKELDHLTGLAATTHSTEIVSDSVCVEPLKKSEEKPQEGSRELKSREKQTDESLPNEMHIDEDEKEMELQDRVLEKQSNVSEVEETMEVGDEDLTVREKDSEGHTAFSQSPPPAPSFAPFTFNFSPTRSPHRATSETKSPALLFSMNSEPDTPCFSGFDMSPSQVEDTTFSFTSSLFNTKNTPESKSSAAEFLFGQPEQDEDFHFSFNFKSPQASSKDKNKDDFPFSFNF